MYRGVKKKKKKKITEGEKPVSQNCSHQSYPPEPMFTLTMDNTRVGKLPDQQGGLEATLDRSELVPVPVNACATRLALGNKTLHNESSGRSCSGR